MRKKYLGFYLTRNEALLPVDRTPRLRQKNGKRGGTRPLHLRGGEEVRSHGGKTGKQGSWGGFKKGLQSAATALHFGAELGERRVILTLRKKKVSGEKVGDRRNSLGVATVRTSACLRAAWGSQEQDKSIRLLFAKVGPRAPEKGGVANGKKLNVKKKRNAPPVAARAGKGEDAMLWWGGAYNMFLKKTGQKESHRGAVKKVPSGHERKARYNLRQIMFEKQKRDILTLLKTDWLHERGGVRKERGIMPTPHPRAMNGVPASIRVSAQMQGERGDVIDESLL